MKGSTVAEKPREERVEVDLDNDIYGDCTNLIARFKAEYFDAQVSDTNCCGIKDIHSWGYGLKTKENTKKIMDALIDKYADDGDPCAFMLFATVKDQHKLLDEYFAARPNTYRTPKRLNRNSNNEITVYMVGV
jgi:hypothetical protein